MSARYNVIMRVDFAQNCNLNAVLHIGAYVAEEIFNLLWIGFSENHIFLWTHFCGNYRTLNFVFLTSESDLEMSIMSKTTPNTPYVIDLWSVTCNLCQGHIECLPKPKSSLLEAFSHANSLKFSALIKG